MGRVDVPLAEITKLALSLVMCPSPNPPGDERAVVDVLKRFLRGRKGVDVSVFEPTSKRQTLVAAVGTGNPCLLLAAHTDTHAVGTGWTVNPLGETAPNGRLYGRGTTDNKGAVAAMAVAFVALAADMNAGRGRLLFVANADEETGGADGVAALCRSWSEKPDAAIVAEASGIWEAWERLWIGARGTSRFTIRTKGTPTHSSLGGREKVDSAIESLLGLLVELESRLPVLGERHPIFGAGNRLTVVRLEGGDGWGSIPGQAVADCELRLLPRQTQERVETEISSAFDAARLVIGSDATLEFASAGLRWMDPSEADSADRIVKIARDAWTSVLEVPAEVGCFPGATDARLFERVGIPSVVIGPGALARAHHADEFVTKDELATAYRIYVLLATTFLGWEANQ